VIAACLLVLLFAPDPTDARTVRDRVRLLRNADPRVRKAAATWLQHVPADRALGAMLVALGDRDAMVRKAAASTLRAWADERAIPFLAKAAPIETNPNVLAEVILAIGTCGKPYAAQHVRRYLEHPARVVRAAAANALGHIGDATDRKLLWAAFRFAPNDPDYAVRATILGAFAALGWSKDAKDVVAALEKENATKEWRVRVAIAAAIGSIRWGERKPWLMDQIRDEKDQRVLEASIRSLAKLGDLDAVAILLQDPRADARKAALWSLDEGKDERALKNARKFATDDLDVGVRFASVMILHRADDPDANVHLVDALRSNDAFFWMNALAALESRYAKELHPKELGRDPAAWTRFFKKRSALAD
jgi:HEAT repeat protein